MSKANLFFLKFRFIESLKNLHRCKFLNSSLPWQTKQNNLIVLSIAYLFPL